MQQLRRNSVSQIVSFILVVALLTPQSLVFVAPAAAQQGQNVPAVAVVPFQDLTGKATPALMQEVTAAAALALEDRKEYVVTSTTDLEREMLALRMSPPLSTAEQIRLGQRLHVEKVLVGSLADLSVDSRTGRARVVLRLMLLDVNIGEYLDGAIAEVETKPIPGFTGDVASVTHEALRQAAEASVNDMLSASVRRGTVELVDDQGNVNLNLGTDDGLVTGSELLVMRPTWQPDVEQVIMRRVGVIRISEAEAGMAVARSVSGSVPTTGDRAYRIYKPVAIMQAEAKSRKIKRGGQLIAGILLLLGLAAVAGGSTNESPSALDCFMAQTGPGDPPTMELRISTGSNARNATHAYLIFRAANNPNFSPSPSNLIDVVEDNRLTRYSDDPFDLRGEEDTFDFEFRDAEGAIDTGSVDYAFIDAPLQQGSRYFYRVRRIINPLSPPGSNPPIGSAQVTLPTQVILTVDPANSISQASAACGPVTFFVPPVLGASPPVNASNVPTENVTFEFTTSIGANEYQIQIFPADDPDGVGAPILVSQVQRTAGATSDPASITIRGPFQAQTTYWWRVGARQSTDPEKPVNLMTGESGWLYSDMRQFTTATTPPPPPGGTTTAQPRRVPARHGGWWGGAGRSGRQ